MRVCVTAMSPFLLFATPFEETIEFARAAHAYRDALKCRMTVRRCRASRRCSQPVCAIVAARVPAVCCPTMVLMIQMSHASNKRLLLLLAAGMLTRSRRPCLPATRRLPASAIGYWSDVARDRR